jgi:hypothetical protein
MLGVSELFFPLAVNNSNGPGAASAGALVNQVHDEHPDKLSRSQRCLRNNTLQLKLIPMGTQPPLTSEAPVSPFCFHLATTCPIARHLATGLAQNVRHWAVHWAAS